MPRRRIWNDDQIEEVEVIETNGNLTLVEKDDGTQDWVAPNELLD